MSSDDRELRLCFQAPFTSALYVEHAQLANDYARLRNELAVAVARALRTTERTSDDAGPSTGRRRESIVEVQCHGKGLDRFVAVAQDLQRLEDDLADEARHRDRWHDLRPRTLLRVRFEERFHLDLGLARLHPEARSLIADARLRLERIIVSYHEHGVGLVSAAASVRLRAGCRDRDHRRLVQGLRDHVFPMDVEEGPGTAADATLVALVRRVDRTVAGAGAGFPSDALARADRKPRPAVFGAEDRAAPGAGGLTGFHWSHLVTIVQAEPLVDGVELEPQVHGFVGEASKVELKNVVPGHRRFAHLGWGYSVLASDDPAELDWEDETNRLFFQVLGLLNVEWRTWDALNALFTKRLHRFSGRSSLLSDGELMRWVDRATVEADLCRAHGDELMICCPLTMHRMAQQLRRAWRMDEQRRAALARLESLTRLYKRGAERRFNLLLFLISCLTGISASVAFVGALAPGFEQGWTLPQRWLVVLAFPLLGLLFLFVQRYVRYPFRDA